MPSVGSKIIVTTRSEDNPVTTLARPPLHTVTGEPITILVCHIRLVSLYPYNSRVIVYLVVRFPRRTRVRALLVDALTVTVYDLSNIGQPVKVKRRSLVQRL